jgi:hypothetical protein
LYYDKSLEPGDESLEPGDNSLEIKAWSLEIKAWSLKPQDAVIRTVEEILQDGALSMMRGNSGSVRFLGAPLAVDAWIENDMPCIQKFRI